MYNFQAPPKYQLSSSSSWASCLEWGWLFTFSQDSTVLSAANWNHLTSNTLLQYIDFLTVYTSCKALVKAHFPSPTTSPPLQNYINLNSLWMLNLQPTELCIKRSGSSSTNSINCLIFICFPHSHGDKEASASLEKLFVFQPSQPSAWNVHLPENLKINPFWLGVTGRGGGSG